MKILIDDVRTKLPDGTLPDLIARTYGAAMELLVSYARQWHTTGRIGWVEDEFYLDHDLGGEDTGYHVICEIERMVYLGEMPPPKRITCVSSNPAGRAKIEATIERIYAKEIE